MLLLLPAGLYFGAQSFQNWNNFKQAEVLHKEDEMLIEQGHYSEGIEKYEESVKLYSGNYGIWEDLAVAHHVNRNLKGELFAYQRAIEALPDNGNLRRELANAYHNNGEHEKELNEAKLAANLENSDEVFTARILERAQREAKGEYPTKPTKSGPEPGNDTPKLLK